MGPLGTLTILEQARVFLDRLREEPQPFVLSGYESIVVQWCLDRDFVNFVDGRYCFVGLYDQESQTYSTLDGKSTLSRAFVLGVDGRKRFV